MSKNKSHKNHTSIIREFSVYTPIKPIFKNCQLDNIIPILTKNIDKTLFLTVFLSLFFVEVKTLLKNHIKVGIFHIYNMVIIAKNTPMYSLSLTFFTRFFFFLTPYFTPQCFDVYRELKLFTLKHQPFAFYSILRKAK